MFFLVLIKECTQKKCFCFYINVVAVVNATMETGSDHDANVKHKKTVKKDMKDGQNNDDDETTKQVKIKQKVRVSGPSEGVHKVKVERDEKGNVIKPSFSKKILKEEAKKHRNNS